MKKLASLAGAGALLLAMAGPALGFWWFDSDDASVRNRAYVRNRVTTKADSGDNSIGGRYVFGGTIRTGAATAVSDVLNDVNTTVLGCDCLDGDLTVRNRASLRNSVYTRADSGDNSIHGKFVGGGLINTGNASAVSGVINAVNGTYTELPAE